MGSKSEPATFLGFLGDRVPPEDTTRACEISQLGGKPRWLTAEPPDTAPFKCRGCGADLDLVCQLTASAGKSGGDANHTQESCETGSNRPSSQSEDTPLLPAFFIEVDEEPMEESTAQKRLDERARELWSDYQRRDDDNSLAQEDEADRAFFGGGAFQNEEYEAAEDKVLQAFQRRLSRNPQQIIRYSFGGKPLWIRTDGIAAGSQEPSRCERCGARRVPGN